MTQQIPFLDLRTVNEPSREALRQAFERVLDSGWYILGEEVSAFEREFATYCGARHCVGVANGLDALTLSLLSMGIGAGDEVIVPSNTFIATWLAVSHCGAKPVPVEPDATSFNIDPARIESAITARTRAIVPVHLYGRPAALQPILELAGRRGLRVLEDAAQAHGATYQGRRIGAHGDAVSWSFYPGKNLGALGDGGAVTTDDDLLADRLRTLRNYGSKLKYHNEVIGFNSRLDELQAAFLRAKLPLLDAGNERRRQIAGQYLRGLQGVDLVLPEVPADAEPVWHLFVVRSRHRDELAARLKERGVATVIHYPVPPHEQQAYAAEGIATGTLPIAEAIHREVLSLPIGPAQTDEQTAQVIRLVRECCQELSS